MMDLIFNSIWTWIGLAGVVVIGCIIVGYLFPSLRVAALAVAGAALTVAGAFAKGYNARARLERKRQDEAVRKVQRKYDDIDKKPYKPSDVERRIRDESF